MSEDEQTQAEAVDTSVDTGVETKVEELPDGVEPLPAEETETNAHDEADAEVTTEETTVDEDDSTAEDATQVEADDSKEKARREWQERQVRKQLAPELSRAVDEARQHSDLSDVRQHLQVIEAERAVERIESELNTAAIEVQQAFKEFEVFQDPTEANEVAQELLDVYGVYSPAIKDASGQPKLLGFRNPRTGERVSPYDVIKREAARIERHREAGARVGQQKEAKMRAVAQTPSTTKQLASRSDDSKLSAEDYAKKYNLKVHEA